MKKQYICPKINVVITTAEDILNGSDVDIDVKDLFEEQ